MPGLHAQLRFLGDQMPPGNTPGGLPAEQSFTLHFAPSPG